MKKLLGLVLACLVVVPAMADETWDTEYGLVIYEQDLGDVAILSYPVDKGRRGSVYFPGLAGNYDNRSVHEGYWIEDGPGSCMVEIVGADGRRSNNWGRAIIAFDKPAFPTGWTALGGDCFGAPDMPLRGDVPF